MKQGTYIKTFTTKREAWAHMCARNKRNDGEMYVLVHGPEDNWAVVDLATAQEIGGGYVFSASMLAFPDDREWITCHRPPTSAEISHGYGATHYRDFTRAQVGYNSKGELKTRFKAEDGLMYSRI